MSFVSFNYWHPERKAWTPVVYNEASIERVEIDPKNATMTRIWVVGESWPGLLTDMTLTAAATALAVPPPGAAPVNPPAL
jgi:hypothetical protein